MMFMQFVSRFIFKNFTKFGMQKLGGSYSQQPLVWFSLWQLHVAVQTLEEFTQLLDWKSYQWLLRIRAFSPNIQYLPTVGWAWCERTQYPTSAPSPDSLQIQPLPLRSSYDAVFWVPNPVFDAPETHPVC
jgi:hypothetical protein